MNIRLLTILRAVLLVAVPASVVTLSGCYSGPHQQPAHAPAHPHDGKDAKDRNR